ncbi:hypothetical protein BTA51_23135 [Hahella sp. CCB-MM4]|uniref:hypothetical protein n=1 Tax=Hahella sp. (strain CCB-MM4) TaxID=1926491 RepID=UPI000BD7A211|nr:hypothetical protein [Hahella sp. CCB-MM4]OZG71002.1 hypothetical protein BTA51_23135 [Hahella sp. CCB-MM4]
MPQLYQIQKRNKTSSMIEFKYNQEHQFAMYFANALNDEIALKILSTGNVDSPVDARQLSLFFWKMVDKSIEMETSGVGFPWTERAEYWTEKLYNTLGGFLENIGYGEIWDEEVDNA